MKESLRINKYLQEAGLCSRRAADELIRAGRVTIDGKTAQLGTKVEPDSLVCVDGRPVLCEERERILIAVNKPVGIVCTEDPREKDNIIGFLHYPKRITYAGRLDKRSQGLLLMTNDGDLIERMMRGRNAHEKEYEVTADRPIADEDLIRMSGGVPIEIEKRSEPGQVETVVTRPCQIVRINDRSFRIILTQGLNRQIRKMCEACGYKVVSLTRVRIMNIRLGDLKPGAWRYVTDEEIQELERLLDA